MQKRTFLTDTKIVSIDAPVPLIGLIVINATDKDCVVTADNGDTFPAPALVISTWSLPPTLKVRAQLSAAPTNGKACNVIVTDDATLNSTSQLATLAASTGGSGKVLATILARVAAQAAGAFPQTLGFDTKLYDTLGGNAVPGTKIVIPTAGEYFALATTFFASGQSGAGGGELAIRRYDSGGTLQEDVAHADFGLSQPGSCGQAFLASALDHIQLDFSAGATGAAGTIVGRLSVMQIAAP